LSALRVETPSQNVTLYLGDCAEILPTLGRFGVLIADPPYEFNTSGGGKFRNARNMLEMIEEHGLADGFDHTLLSRFRADSVVCFCHNDQLPKLLPWFASQFERVVLCAWHKDNPMPVANRHYQPDTEFYIHAWSGHAFPRGTLADKKRYVFAPVGKSEFEHPTVKPLKIMRKIIVNVGPLSICDPFMGTGSTGVAAVEAGRRFVGIEREPKFFEIAVQRISEALLSAPAIPLVPADEKRGVLL